MRLWWLVLRVACPLSLVFIAAVGLIRVRPYENENVRGFLLPPEGCPAPCFLGVRPGVTPGVDAIQILEAQDWIERVVRSADFYDLTWSDARPDFVDTTAMNYLFVPTQLVGWIRLDTRLRLGDVLLTLGPPEGVFSRPGGSGHSVYHSLIYRRFGLEIGTVTLCPVTRAGLWNTPVEVRLETRFASLASVGLYRVNSLYSACRGL